MTCPDGYSLSACRDYLHQEDAFFRDWTMAQGVSYAALLLLILLGAMVWVSVQPTLDEWWIKHKERKP